MKRSHKDLIIVVVWIMTVFIGIGLMSVAYETWSNYGEYTVISFLVSILIHFLPIVFIGYSIARIIKNL